MQLVRPTVRRHALLLSKPDNTLVRGFNLGFCSQQQHIDQVLSSEIDCLGPERVCLHTVTEKAEGEMD